MGTSSSHRSPSTPEWERVKQLYRQPDADPGQLSSRIASALDAGSRRDLSGPGVACCLSALLGASGAAARDALSIAAAAPPLLAISQALREQAEREVAAGGFASRFTDIAINALGTATFEAAARGSASLFDVTSPEVVHSLAAYTDERRLHDLSLCFVAHDFDHLFRHFVTRDTPDFVGGDGLPTIAHASQLRDAVAAHCRRSVAALEASIYEDALGEALRADPRQQRERLQEVLSDLTQLGLQQLAAGG